MDLKIIGGIYKNRSIKLCKAFKNQDIRPTLVRARMNVFDTIISRVPDNFTFLDGFAGSGIMGMEALSRKASKVVFFDINTLALKSIRDNIKSMEKIKGSFSTIRTKIFQAPEGSPVDVVFLDPPYSKYYIIPDVIKYLKKKNWINSQTFIVTETSMYDSIEFPDFLSIFKIKRISSSLIHFLEHKVDTE